MLTSVIKCVIIFIGLLECQTVIANGICPGQSSVNGSTGCSMWRNNDVLQLELRFYLFTAFI